MKTKLAIFFTLVGLIVNASETKMITRLKLRGEPLASNGGLYFNQPFEITLPKPITDKPEDLFLVVNNFPFRIYTPISDYSYDKQKLVFNMGLAPSTAKIDDIAVEGKLATDIIDWNRLSSPYIEWPFTTKNIQQIAVSNKEGKILCEFKNINIPFHIQKGRAWAAILTCIGLMILLTFIIVKLNFTYEVVNGTSQPSLRMTVIGFWTVVIISTFVYCWIIMESLPLLNSSTLVLMGIVVLSGAAGTKKLAFAKLQNTVTPGPPLTTTFGEQFYVWLKTVVSGANGAEIYRLQNLLFTLIFGVAFVVYGIFHFKFLAFTSTQLALMGISSGAYLGLKWANEE